MTISPNDDPPPAAPSESEGLFCPSCDYDLTGLTRPRCPECGKPFDREELLRWNDPETRLNGPLLRDALAGTISYKRVFLGSLFTPRRLARDLSPVPGLYTAMRYSVLTRTILVCIIFSAFFVVMDEGFIIACIMSPSVLLGSIISEVFIAKALARYVPPRNVPPDYRYRFWRTMCQCFSGYLCMTVPVFILYCDHQEKAGLGWSAREAVGYVLIILVYLSILWWWYSLGVAIVTRGKPSGARTLLVLLIPLFAAMGILLAWAILILSFIVVLMSY